MIDVVIRNNVAPGKLPQALEWAKKLIAYTKEAGFLEEATILRPVTGESYGFSFVLPFASMAEFEERRKKWTTDSGWLKVLREGHDSGWHLGIRRNIYEVVE